MLVDGLRQAEVAERLRIARPTVSVAVERARVREIGRLRHALLALVRGIAS
jgi:DNA-binding transcriptional regulator LsrR (DeoR family)